MVGLAAQHDMARSAQAGRHADRRGRVRTNCPFCLERKGSADRRGSLLYYRSSGFYKCFRCFIKSIDHLGGDGRVVDLARQEFRATGGPPEFAPLWHDKVYPGPLGEAVQYLEGRGIDAEIRAQAFIGCCLRGRYANRVIVPHLDRGGTWWGWSARTWRKVPGVRPYDYPPGMTRAKLYNGHVVEEETDRPVMVVEGTMDALLYLPHVVACLGQPNHDHFDSLASSKRPVALCLDGDRWEVSRSWALRLRGRGVRVGWVRLPSGEDPNSVDAAMLREAADTCVEKGMVRC